MKKYTFLYILIFSLFTFLNVTTVLAQGFDALAPIPGLTDQPGTELTIVDYLERIFFLAISAGALIAVVRIAIAGFKYMMTDVITSKGDAREDIKGAFIGLAILLSTVIVLTVINPNLLNLDILTNAKKLAVELDGSQERVGGAVVLPAPEEHLEKSDAEKAADRMQCPDGHKPSINETLKDEESGWDDVSSNWVGADWEVECRNIVPRSEEFKIYDIKRDGVLKENDDGTLAWQPLIDAAANKAIKAFEYCKSLTGYTASLQVPSSPKTTSAVYRVFCKFDNIK